MSKKSKHEMVSMDGNTAAAYTAYAFTEIAAIYPITPSSPMAESVDEWATYGKENIFGETVHVVELQSEGGAAGTVHGSLQAGVLTTTFTASQGLLLMIPNMYKIAGELLPAVFHVSARSLSTHALSIFGDHSDIYAARQTGFAMLASGSVQEVMDLSAIAHLSSIKGRLPFMHFFDGFRTSHEIQKIEAIDHESLKELVDYNKIAEFRKNSLNPETPSTRGTAQNPDIYFQARESQNKYYQSLPDIVDEYMEEIFKLTGRKYHPFTYYGDKDAENIIVAMGSVTETIRETIDYLSANGEKSGLITCHLYRPFSADYFFKVLPESVKKIAVLDRTKEPGSTWEPLCLDVKSIFYGKKDAPVIVGGRYGLSSKDTTPAHVMAVYDNLKKDKPEQNFTVGINDDVTFTSLPVSEAVSVVPEGTFEAKFYGLGSDGTVGANKNTIKIIGDTTDLFAQAYFSYDSKKSGGVTVSHLRFGKKPIRSTYLITTPDFVACHVPAYLEKYNVLQGLKKGGSFLLNSMWSENEIEKHLPDTMKKYIAENEIRFFIINGTEVAEQVGMPGRINSIMQAAFFQVTNIISYDKAKDKMIDAVIKSYGKKGDEIVKKNISAIERGGLEVTEVNVPAAWKEIKINDQHHSIDVPDFIKDVAVPINNLNGDSLPVSTFYSRPDGSFPNGTTAYEKRGVAVNIPEWQPETCIQCGQCSFVCPHAVIRPFLLNSDEAEKAPDNMVLIDAKGKNLEGLKYRLQVSPLDCYGCGVCVDVCPSKDTSLVMKPLSTQFDQISMWDFTYAHVSYKSDNAGKYTVKGSQFCQPLFEFHGACAGCGETPYIKLITQLYGDRMVIANATGCSSIYGGTAASSPYCTNAQGRGPAWASSLFEDNAEYGYGMYLGYRQMRNRVTAMLQNLRDKTASSDLSETILEWLLNKDIEDEEISDKLISLLEKENNSEAQEILTLRQYIRKRSVWIIGGDGWAYDIGYGGLDHVLASGENVNVLVMDTELYSNTGGQASKATPAAAIAKFAASGKKIRKKDLGMMAISYGYIYVAQVAMGASQTQYIKALREAENYPGPSLIIAYSPCISHGIKSGMNSTQSVMKNAVNAGYWHLFRYNPLLEKEGKNPFILDSKEPDWTQFRSFLMNETRYTTLKQEFPDIADELFSVAEGDAKKRYETYKKQTE